MKALMAHSDDQCLFSGSSRFLGSGDLVGYRIDSGECNALPLNTSICYLRDRFIHMCRRLQEQLIDADGLYLQTCLLDTSVWGDRIVGEIVNISI